MSLAQLIAQRMLAKKATAAPAEKSTEPRVVSPPAGHTRPPPVQPARVPQAEIRRRRSVGQLRRLEPEPFVAAPVHPGFAQMDGDDDADGPPIRATVPTSAPPGPRTITERPPPLPPVAPRAELEIDLVKGLEALPLPAAPPASSPPAPARGRGSCFAIDAGTGRQCRLPAHPEDPDRHRNERGPFFRVLQPGEVPKLREQLDAVSTRRSSDSLDLNRAGSAPTPVPRKRDKAHAGELTTEAHAPEDSKYFTPPENRGGNLNFSGLLQDASGTAFHRAGVILPDGELLDDVEASPTPTTEVS